MPSPAEVLAWFTSGTGRALAAALLVVVMYAVKHAPFVKRYLTTPRRKMAANALLALGPAVYLLADQSVPWPQVVITAVEVALAAMGIHVAIKVGIRGKPVGDKTEDGDAGSTDRDNPAGNPQE